MMEFLKLLSLTFKLVALRKNKLISPLKGAKESIVVFGDHTLFPKFMDWCIKTAIDVFIKVPTKLFSKFS